MEGIEEGPGWCLGMEVNLRDSGRQKGRFPGSRWVEPGGRAGLLLAGTRLGSLSCSHEGRPPPPPPPRLFFIIGHGFYSLLKLLPAQNLYFCQIMTKSSYRKMVLPGVGKLLNFGIDFEQQAHWLQDAGIVLKSHLCSHDSRDGDFVLHHKADPY